MCLLQPSISFFQMLGCIFYVPLFFFVFYFSLFFKKIILQLLGGFGKKV
mgnify:CR=1 FL=1